ncbi:MAG: rane bound O-acyl transferase family protein [Pedosphaera sp.]|nr:rane bound O-acyl transferase family protein [Pedosphaera sp.]
MFFSSWQFIFVFLPVAVLGFFLLPPRPAWLRKAWLLLASLCFYGYWKVEYIPLLLFSIGFNYTVAEIITRHRHRPITRVIFVLGIGLNLLLLGYYKYTNFILDLLGRATQHDLGRFDIILPLAISFFTFTQIGYLADVYRNQSLHYRFLDYTLFVVFFPHLIAGPIVRHWEIIPQFAERNLKANRTDIGLGLALFLIGLYKKVLLADSVAGYVSSVYGAAEQGLNLTWFDAWLGTLAFALQIYFDFSGYSDMAIGLARLFGIKFPVNFDSPYQAASITEFWQRWHITLTRFLREYLYFPLGGNRCSPARHMLNLMVTMLLSGLWHGAGWTFVIWGGLHGMFLVVAHRWGLFVKTCGWRLNRWWYRSLSVALTFLVAMFAWVLFRAPTLPVAAKVLSTMIGRHGLTMSQEVTNPAKQPGLLWAQLGVHFVPKTFEVDSYTLLLELLLLMLAIAFFMPNSQQLLAAYAPALEPAQRPARLRLTLGLRDGLFLGGIFFCVLRSFYATAPSPFLYFNF